MGSLAQIRVGGVTIGGGAPVVVQSMTLTKTHDVEATTAQIAALVSAGCEVVRCAVPKIEDADAIMLYHHIGISARTIERLQQCQLIVRCGVGFDNVDRACARASPRRPRRCEDTPPYHHCSARPAVVRPRRRPKKTVFPGAAFWQRAGRDRPAARSRRGLRPRTCHEPTP